MRYSTVKLFYYINEAVDKNKDKTATNGYGDLQTPPELLTAPNVKDSNTEVDDDKKVHPLVDPGVMGKGDKEEKDTAVDLGNLTSIYGAYKLLPGKAGAESAIGHSVASVTADLMDPVNRLNRLNAEMRAQQEAVRNMSNISNYYKNLGSSTIPLRSPDDSGLLGKLRNMLQVGGMLPGAKKP